MHALSFADSTVKHTLFYFIFVFNKFDKYFTLFFLKCLLSINGNVI